MLLTLFVFAAQSAAFQSQPHDGGPLLAPLALLAVAAAVLVGSQAFAARPVSAALVSSAAIGAFLYGEAYCNTALDVMHNGRMDWWSEAVAGTLVIIVAPATLVTAIGAFVLSRLLGKSSS